MRVHQLTVYRLCLPLKREIRHASYSRKQSENLLVSCTLANGTKGWGEGIPRTYVTGESVDGALQQLAAASLEDQLHRECYSWHDVIQCCESLQFPLQGATNGRGCYGNALRCAVELSLLDAYGQLFGQPLSRVADHFSPAETICAHRDEVRYSAVITTDTQRAEMLTAAKMRIYGFSQCKVKVGMASIDEARRLRRIRRWLGRHIDIRLDANEAWNAADVIQRIEPLLEHGISSVEQPVPHEEVSVLSELRRHLPVRVMLDESLTSPTDADRAIDSDTCDMFNIRLSKCGGFLGSLRLAARAHSTGLGYQLGCHPGESGILSAAGRHFATSVADIAHLKGSYDRHILQEQLTREDVTFGYGGRATAPTRPGLGVTVNPQSLQRLTSLCQTFTLN